MALLFPREEDKDFAATTDAATRSLSAISLETSFVEGVYEKMASVYDVFFGLPLHHGRAKAYVRCSRSAARSTPAPELGSRGHRRKLLVFCIARANPNL